MIWGFIPVARLLGLALAATGAANSSELTGTLTEVKGAVQLAGPGVQGSPLAQPWQVIRTGVRVLLPEGSAVRVVCSNRRLVLIQRPGSWSLTEPTCAAGKELTAGQYALVAPKAGRFKVIEGLLTLEREIRGANEDDPLAPLVLSPRNTVLHSPRPEVTWQRVPAAIEYRVEWRGRRTRYDDRLKSEEIACAVGPDGAGVCSLSWRADRPDLGPDDTFFLRVAAREGIVESWHWTDLVEVRTQSLTKAAALESRLRDLENLGLEGAGLEIARAGLLAQEGLYTEAALGYRRALAVAPTPELRVTLADVDLSIGLLHVAEQLYRQPFGDSAPCVQAAAAFGLGRVAYARACYREAAMAFRHAHEIFARLQETEEADAARQAAEKAAAHASR